MKKKNKLNKFEETRLYSARALEIADGAKPNINIDKNKKLKTQDYIKIAIEEEKKNKLELEIYK